MKTYTSIGAAVFALLLIGAGCTVPAMTTDEEASTQTSTNEVMEGDATSDHAADGDAAMEKDGEAMEEAEDTAAMEKNETAMEKPEEAQVDDAMEKDEPAQAPVVNEPVVEDAMEKDDNEAVDSPNAEEAQADDAMEKEDTEKEDSQAATESAGPGTYTTYDAGQIASAATNGDAVLFFHAPWCPTCAALSRNIENNAAQIPAGVTIFKTDYDSNIELRKRYGVTYQHTLVQVDAQGNQIAKWSGGNTLQSILSKVQ